MACNSEVTGVPVPLPPSWLSDFTSGVRPRATLTDLVHAVVNEEEEGRRVSSLPSGDGESEASGRCKRQNTSGGAEDKNSVDIVVLRKLYSSIRNYLGGTRTPVSHPYFILNFCSLLKGYQIHFVPKQRHKLRATEFRSEKNRGWMREIP